MFIENNDWKCKICIDVPQYIKAYYLKREANTKFDYFQLKYYYSLLELHKKCYNDCYDCEFHIIRKLICEYITKTLNQYDEFINYNGKCDICAILPYAISTDLEIIANDIPNHFSELSKMQLYQQILLLYFSQYSKCTDCASGLELCYMTDVLSDYLNNKNCKKLKEVLIYWNKARAYDNIFNIGVATKIDNFDTVKKIKNSGKKYVYFDFNVFDKYEKDLIFKDFVDKKLNKNNFQIVYGPTHMEEICRMNSNNYELHRRNTIKQLTRGTETLVIDDRLVICFEEIDACFHRAKINQDLNQHAEVLSCVKSEEKSILHVNASSEEFKNKINNIAFDKIFENNSLISKKKLNQILVREFGCYSNIDEYKHIICYEEKHSVISDAIRKMYRILDVLGYKANKLKHSTKLSEEDFYPIYNPDNYKTIRSGFFDLDHLCYAYKCDFFVTNDTKLYHVAKAIYHYLGCCTKILLFKDFAGNIDFI